MGKDSSISSSTPNSPRTTYQRRLDEFDGLRRAAHARWSLVANARLLAFAAVAGFGWFALRRGSPSLWVATGIALVLAMALVVWHGHLRRRRDRLAAMKAVNEAAIARYELDWDTIPVPLAEPDVGGHPYARDLDIVGPTSLLARISTPVLPSGAHTLRSWLLAPADLPQIARRQEAVRALAIDLETRQEVEATGRTGDEPFPDPGSFVEWSEQDTWLISRTWVWMLAIASPATALVMAGLFFTGVLTWPWWLVPVAVNVALYQIVGRRVTADLAQVAPVQTALAGYAEVFARIGAADTDAGLLNDIRQALGANGGATSRMRHLVRISSFAMPRGSILWMPLQIALLWDVNVVHALERWRRDSGNRPRTWFERAGEWEALAALSVLAHDFPDWTFPVLDEGTDRIEASDLRHPLIEPDVAVANDVTVGPVGTFLFVTGSNMSGKSTLLRAIGINAVLAAAGGPVAASRMALPLLDIRTCMRVEDSLARGVSFFMAELQRLKAVVDAASAATERPVLALLDEILQGTNTAERQVASRQVLAQLAASHCLCAVSSHDLGLVEGSTLAASARCVHFAETFEPVDGKPSMTFDYRLRPGLATTTNALALMDMLGFDIRNKT